MLWDLFCTFFKIGLVSFGGGYTMIPVIQYEVEKHGWLTTREFANAIAIAGMSPGPIAANSAVFIGYKTAGMPGAIISIAATLLPSLILLVLISLFFVKVQNHPFVQSVFYSLRPIILSLICFAAIQFALGNQLIGGDNWIDLFGIFLVLGCLSILQFTKIHPVVVILLSGFAGMLVYS
ncbi:chromate transporter [Brevibacillus sp. B_LB10_24]|uniref:chromate transporter n=1 Tax=Brevibacillus sp. B_LB10_24 TaxID=3380645 RepID=UPI0038BC3643